MYYVKNEILHEEIENQDLANTTRIPMSDPKENGRYFLKSHDVEGEIENIEYVRIGDEHVSYGKAQIKRSSYEMRKYTSANHGALESADLGEWFTPIGDGTDKDIFNFICGQ